MADRKFCTICGQPLSSVHSHFDANTGEPINKVECRNINCRQGRSNIVSACEHDFGLLGWRCKKCGVVYD